MNGNQLAWTLAALGAGMGGWQRGKMARQEMDEAQADQDFRRQERARMQQQWERDDQVRAALAGAATPTDVQTVAAPPNPDTTAPDGTVIRERPLPDTYTVNGQNFGSDQAAAQAASADQNQPYRVLMRQAGAVQGIDPMLAGQLRTQADQQQLNSIKLSEAQQQHVNRLFDESLGQANSFDDLAKVISDSKADGEGGALKVKAVASADGKKVNFVRLNDDGTTSPSQYSFDNSPKGLLEAKQTLSRIVPVGDKLTHLHQNAMEDLEQKKLTQQEREHRETLAAENTRELQRERTSLITAGLLAPDGKPVSDDQVESLAKQYASGDLPVPASRGGKLDPVTRRALQRAGELNPNFGAANKTLKDFSTGKQGNAIRSFNVSLSHLDTLDRLTDALGNGNTKIVNKVANEYAAQTGGTAPTNFDAAKKIVTDEVVKAIVGSGGGVGDREAAAATIDKANSPAQLKQVISTYKELMRGQLDGLRQQYEANTGRDDFDRYLSDNAKNTAKGGKGAGAAPPLTNSKGWTLHRDAKGNMAYVSPDGKQFEEVK
jgi:hypothetical protein